MQVANVYCKCLLHFKKTSFSSLAGDRRHLVDLIIRPDWLKTLSLAAELHGAEKSCIASSRKLDNFESLYVPSPSELLFRNR